VMNPAFVEISLPSSAMSGSSSTIRMRVGMTVILLAMTTVEPQRGHPGRGSRLQLVAITGEMQAGRLATARAIRAAAEVER